MNRPYVIHADSSANQIRLKSVFAKQQRAYKAAPYPALKIRRQQLQSLRRQVIRYQDVLAAALSKDFGLRSIDESKMFDMLASVLDANHTIGHLRRWMRPSKRSTEWLFKSNSVQVQYQPKGVVGVIVPWNFPVYLAIGPLITALAAGNRVMLKLSEFTPETNAIVRRMLGEIFSDEEVAVFGEEIVDPSAFTTLPFNHIVFTGSPAIGRIVMRAAAENLTPVTLELGGKSPALVTRNFAVADAAMRIIHGKSMNSGQICVAPDYALVPRELVDIFVEECRASFMRMFGSKAARNPNYTSVINERHMNRIRDILKDAESKGARIIPCGEYQSELEGRRLPVHLVVDCKPDMRVMQEELFGPILPIVAYDQLDDAIAYINHGERPLALYCFTHDAKEREQVLRQTHSGGVTINDWGWHVVNHDAPFGGIGNSGMGTYHGEEGFRELSHAKTVFKKQPFFPIGLFYPPYDGWVQKFALRLFLGKGDPSL